MGLFAFAATQANKQTNLWSSGGGRERMSDAAPISSDHLVADESHLVCPRCGRSIEKRPLRSSAGGVLPRCPEHGLAFVHATDLAFSNHDPLLGRTIANRFTILAQLGRGSMGAVYRARQEAVGRDVALKILRSDRGASPETRVRFEREARAICALTSPHTVTAFDFGEDEDGSWYLAMEMLEGETVGERLRREGRFEWSVALACARDALWSLAEAHEKGIIHRDLKPDNLFLCRTPEDGSGTPREVCKVLDFGIAKWAGVDLGNIDQLETQAGTVFGTPRYMAPEQAQGLPLDGRSDLYSLGVLLYHMITGRAPFIDDDAVVVMARHIKDEPPRFGEASPGLGVPDAIERVVFRALRKAPEDRPANAHQFIELIDIAMKEALAAGSGVRSVVAPTERRRHWTPIAIGVVLFAICVAGLFAGRAEGTRVDQQELARSSTEAVNPELTKSDPQSAEASKNSDDSAKIQAPADVKSVAVPRRKVAPRRAPPASAPTLERRGNERYGRFD